MLNKISSVKWKRDVSVTDKISAQNTALSQRWLENNGYVGTYLFRSFVKKNNKNKDSLWIKVYKNIRSWLVGT